MFTVMVSPFSEASFFFMPATSCNDNTLLDYIFIEMN